MLNASSNHAPPALNLCNPQKRPLKLRIWSSIKWCRTLSSPASKVARIAVLIKVLGVSGGGEPLHLHSTYATSISDIDWEKCKQHSNYTLKCALKKLHEKKDTVSATQFKILEQMYGFAWNPYNVILNERYDIELVSALSYDWAHGYLCDGAADAELGLVMQCLQRQTPVGYKDLGAYVQGWTFPKTLGSVMHLFKEVACRQAVRKGVFTCTASEFLTLSPVLKRFFVCICRPQGDLPKHVESFISVLTVIEELQGVKRGASSPDALRGAIEDHFRKFIDAFGVDWVRPKHHYNRHLPDMLRRFGVLLNTLVHERKHRLVKKYATRSNLRKYDLGVLEDVTAHMMVDIVDNFLDARSCASPSPRLRVTLADVLPGFHLASIVVHSMVSVQSGRACVGDVLLYVHEGARCVGELLVAASSSENEVVAVLSCWDLLDMGDHVGYTTYAVRNDVGSVVPLRDLQTALTCRFSGRRGQCLVYLPLGFR